MITAARQLHRLGCKAVLVKGGHLPGETGILDVYFDGDRLIEMPTPRIDTVNTHGTGCTLAACIACYLARQQATEFGGSSSSRVDVVAAIRSAKAYLHSVLLASQPTKIGTGAHGPMLHYT